MSSADLFEDGFPHGTKEGYDRGCRGHGSCPGVLDFGRSCNQASMNYSGDYTYRKRVDAGLGPAEIRDLEAQDAAATKQPKRVSGFGTNLTAGLNEAAPYAEPTVTVESNQTPIRPEDFEEVEAAAVAEDGIRLERHGTRFGYQDGCRLKEACPGIERTGVSCTQAVSAYQLELKRKRRAQAERPSEPSGGLDEQQAPEAEIVAEPAPLPTSEPVPADESLDGVETGTRVRAEDLLIELADTKEGLEKALAELAEMHAQFEVQEQRIRENAAEHERVVAGLREELVQAGIDLDVEKAKSRDLVVAGARELEQLGATPPRACGGAAGASVGGCVCVRSFGRWRGCSARAVVRSGPAAACSGHHGRVAHPTRSRREQ